MSDGFVRKSDVKKMLYDLGIVKCIGIVDMRPIIELDKMPSIDIVPCKDCIYNPWDKFDPFYLSCPWESAFVEREQTPYDFCSCGKRSR